ncbi:MAG: WD40/YVTN/BNR-like repeat-containing protein [Phycisphaerae bacterium]
MVRSGRWLLQLAVVGLLALHAHVPPALAADAKSPVAAEPYVWKNVVIEGGGYVPGIVMHPAERGLEYIRTDIGGAYRRSSDDGGKWIPLTDWVGMDNVNTLGCESVAIDPSDASRLYLALGTYVAPWSKNGVIARSTDRGRTFAFTQMPFQMGGNNPGRAVGERLVVDPQDGRVLFFASRTAGLWRSTDHAATWKKVQDFPAAAEHAGLFGISFITFDTTQTPAPHGEPTSTLYAGIGTKGESLFRSTDTGEHWQPVPNAPTGLLPIHGVIARDGMLYISYGDPPGPESMLDGALWRFNTKTSEWKDISPARPKDGDRFGYGGIAVSAEDPHILMATTFARWSAGDSIFRSTDRGQSWKETSVRNPDPATISFNPATAPYAASIGPHWMSDIAIDPFDSSHATFVTGFGLWTTFQAANMQTRRPTRWDFDNRGIEETAVLELKSPPAGPHLVSALGDIDGFRHDDLDRSPASGRFAPSIGTTPGLDFAGQKPEVFVRSGNDGQGFLSTDGAATWKPFAAAPPDAKSLRTLAISADARALVWSSGNATPFYSPDQGATWSPCQGIPAAIDVLSDRVRPAGFYALDRASGKLFRSDDGGAHFSVQHDNLHAARLFVSPAAPGDLWIASPDNGLAHSLDAGKTFSPLASIHACWTLGFGKPAPGRSYPALYAVGQINSLKAVFRSDDTGATWTRINDDQHQYGWIGQTVIGDPRLYGRVYLATNGRGILYADPQSTTAKPAAAQAP